MPGGARLQNTLEVCDELFEKKSRPQRRAARLGFHRRFRPARRRRVGSANVKTLSGLDVADSDLARAAIFLRVEQDFLALRQAAHASALKRGSVDEHVLAAVCWSYKAVTFLIVVKFNGTWIHSRMPFQG
jgi:hypothetical protein